MYQVDVPLAGLVAGDYRFELTARGAGTTTTEVVTFRILP
jgi:hypothetical protein